MRIPPFLLPLAVWSLLHFAAARADEWVIDRSISARASYNDNLNLQPTNQLSSASLTFTPSMLLSSRTETRDVNIRFDTPVNQYLQHPEYNSIDHRAVMAVTWKTELDQRSLTLSSVTDSTLTSELAATGVVLTRTQRTATSAQGTWQHSLTERTSVNAALNLTSVHYQPAPGVVDYEDQSASVGLRYVLSERVSLGGLVATREYRTDASVQSYVNTVSISGQWQYSERLQFSLDAGGNRVRIDQQVTTLQCPLGFINIGNSVVPLCAFVPNSYQTVVVPVETKGRGTSFNGATTYQFESGSLSASVSRSLSPSGSGSLLRTDQVGLTYQRRFSETVDFSFSAGEVRSVYLGSTAGATRYINVSPSLQWRIDPFITLSFGLNHVNQSSAGQAQAAQSNVVFVTLNYAFRPLSVSR